MISYQKGKRMIGKIKKIFRILLLIILILTIIGGLMVLFFNVKVYKTAKNKILTEEEAAKLEDIDCILVLGAGVKPDGTPSFMLEDRIKEGIRLYEIGVSNVIIMSGDHGTKYYDEVNCMKNYAVNSEVPSSAVFMDHAGFSTYDSMYRAKNIFGAKKILIVTQDYHMYRAIYDAEKLGIQAYGVIANPREYSGQLYRDIREVMARCKDVIKCVRKPKAQIMGNPISLEENGDITNDK